MRKALGAVVGALMLAACGGQGTEPGLTGPGEERIIGSAEGLSLEVLEGRTHGTFAQKGEEVRFSSQRVEEGTYRIEVRSNGMTLTGLVDPVNGVSSLDGFADGSGQDTQMLDGDRALLSALYAALNAELPAGDAAAPESMYLRRAVSLWSQHPTTVELQRTVMGEEGRGYTMLCSYAKCNNGKYTGSCNGLYVWYNYAQHDCNRGGFTATINQQRAQLGDHHPCSGDEWYSSNAQSFVCGEPDHWSRPYVVGNCFGRCGGGCGGDTQYTKDATNHDGCVRNGHAIASGYCNDQFAAASDDEMYAPNCY